MLHADPVAPKAPRELTQTVREQLQALTRPAPHVVVSPRRSITRYRWLAAAAALAFVFLSVFFFSDNRQEAWAQVASALRQVNWIHILAVSEAEKAENVELWMSFPQDVSARTDPSMARFDDYRNGVRLEYDRQKDLLFRTPINEDQERYFRSIRTVMTAMMEQSDQLCEEFAEDRIVGRSQREVKIDGKDWLELELKLEQSTANSTVAILIDPESHLPDLMTWRSGNKQMKLKLEYPATGPADIYALDVPKDAKIEDRMPSADLQKIAEAQNRNRMLLENYVAFLGEDPDFPTRIIYRGTDQWKVSLCMTTQPWLNKQPTGEPEKVLTWQEREQQFQLWPIVMCDGKRVWKADRNKEPLAWNQVETVRVGESLESTRRHGDACFMLEWSVYPDLNSYPQLTLTLKENPTEGPAGCVLVVRSFPSSDPGTFQTQKYWLDPQYGYAVVKYEYSDCQELEDDPSLAPGIRRPTFEFAGFERSPHGVWYPTKSIAKGVNVNPDAKDDDPSKYSDITTYYRFHFDQELPGTMFVP